MSATNTTPTATTTAPTTKATAKAVTQPTQPTTAATVPAVPSIAPFRLSECEDRADFLSQMTKAVDHMATMPKGMEAEDRAEWKTNASRAHRLLIRSFPILEAMTDIDRFTITVAVVVKDAAKEKTRDRRPVRLSDAVYARLGLHGRTVESVGLA